MKFPLTPSRAYFSRKKNFVGSGSIGASPVLEPFSELEPSTDDKDAEVVSGGIGGV